MTNKNRANRVVETTDSDANLMFFKPPPSPTTTTKKNITKNRCIFRGHHIVFIEKRKEKFNKIIFSYYIVDSEPLMPKLKKKNPKTLLITCMYIVLLSSYYYTAIFRNKMKQIMARVAVEDIVCFAEFRYLT